MKLRWLLPLAALAGSAFAQSPPAYVNIITSTACLKADAAGDALTGGTLSVSAVNALQAVNPFTIGGGGLAMTRPVTRTITGGALVGSLQLANPAVTSPTGIGYNFVFSALSSVSMHWPYRNYFGGGVEIDENGNANFGSGAYLNPSTGSLALNLITNRSGSATVMDGNSDTHGQFNTPADTATCATGAFRVDASYIYVCTATNTWKRAALTTY